MQYGLHKFKALRGYNLVTDKPEITLKFLKNATVTVGQESTPLTRDGTPMTHFDHSASFMIEGESAVIDDGLLSLQLGSNIEILTNTNEIRISEKVTINSNASASTYTATGVVGAELKFVEILDASDNVVEVIEQMTGVITTKKFTYTAGTKALAFFAGDYVDGTKARLHYYPTVASARKISKLVGNSSATLRWECDVIYKDVCNSQETNGYIYIPKGKLSASTVFATSEAGDPAVQGFSLTAEQTCLDELWDHYIYSTADLS